MHTHMQTLAAHSKAVCLSRSACSVQVPLIEAQPSEVDLGDCYLYYPYSSCVELINRSGLFARYSLQGQVGTGRGGRWSCVQGTVQGKLPAMYVADSATWLS